ncbi:TlpA family protein disulfide reductase [Sinomicrobium sp.]
MRKLLIAFLAIPFVSCNDSIQKTAYFGGEIINPRDSIVILYKDDEPVDTAILDSQNRFLFKLGLDDKEGDLFKFRHFPEHQYVYIQGGDSVMARVNTLNFDESLVFSGRGSEKNNFLIEMFIRDEEEQRLIYNYYSLNPEAFSKKIDSLRAMKLEQYEYLIVNHRLSDAARNVAKASVDYPNYKSREFYPYMHKRLTNIAREDLLDLPDDFFDFRKDVNYNDKDLSFYKPYFDFMITHFNSMAYAKCVKECQKGIKNAGKSVHYFIHRLELVDSKVKEETLKDYLFRNTAYAYYLEDQNEADNLLFLEKFRALDKSNKYKNEIESLYNNIRNLSKGATLPSLKLIDTESQQTDLSQVYQHQNTVIYFWTFYQKGHSKYINDRVISLEQEYPTVNFVGICLNENYDEWMQTILSQGLREQPQYLSLNQEAMSRELTINSLNKVIVVDRHNHIVNAFTHINSRELYRILKSL